MADHDIAVPDSGAGSGSSTATFGEALGHIFAMPASPIDTSSAAEDSGVDVVFLEQSSKPRRRPPGEVSGSPGSRSPARTTPPRHGASPSSSTRRPSTHGNPRGRSGSRNLSDQVSENRERPSRGTLSPAGSHHAPTTRDRSHYGSPSQQASSLGSPASVPYGYTPTRLDTPTYIPTPRGPTFLKFKRPPTVSYFVQQFLILYLNKTLLGSCMMLLCVFVFAFVPAAIWLKPS